MASIRRPKDLERLSKIEVPDNLNLKQFLKHLGYNFNEIRVLQAFSSENGSRIGPKETLADGQQIFLTIPVGGG